MNFGALHTMELLDSTCRLCMKQYKSKRFLRNICITDATFNIFVETFEFCIGQKPPKNSGAFICKLCDQKMNQFFRFKSMCLENATKIETADSQAEEPVSKESPVVAQENNESFMNLDFIASYELIGPILDQGEASKDGFCLAENIVPNNTATQEACTEVQEACSEDKNQGDGDDQSQICSTQNNAQEEIEKATKAISPQLKRNHQELVNQKNCEAEGSCPICGLQVQSLKDHIQKHKLYRHCDKCSAIVKRGSYNKHMEKHEEQCEVCHKEFSSAIMPVHKLRHKDPNFYTAEDKEKYKNHYCAQHNIFVTAMESHLKAKHSANKNELFSCEFCGKCFNTHMKLCYHMADHKGQFQCDLCHKVFQNRNRINTHMETVHLKKQTFCCTQCSKGFAIKQHLKDHIRDIHDSPTFACDYCTKVFSNRPRLQQHIKNVHKKIQDHVCVDCGARYGLRTALLYHQSVAHSAEAKETRTCVCGTETYSAKALRDHLDDEHVDMDGRYHCTCGKHFGARCRLVTHLIKFHEMPPMREISNNFKCPVCSVGYSSSYALKYHFKKTQCGLFSISSTIGLKKQK